MNTMYFNQYNEISEIIKSSSIYYYCSLRNRIIELEKSYHFENTVVGNKYQPMGEVIINKASVFQPRTTYFFVMSEFCFETMEKCKILIHIPCTQIDSQYHNISCTRSLPLPIHPSRCKETKCREVV